MPDHQLMTGFPGVSAVRVHFKVDGDDRLVDTRLSSVAASTLSKARPVREFRSYRGRKHYSGWYWSSTTGGHVVYESLLELRRIMVADFDPQVSWLVAQPFQLSVEIDGSVRRHVPDLLLLHRDKTVTVSDVKPANRIENPVVQSTFAWTSQAVSEKGWDFEVWSGDDSVRLENIRFLAGYRRPAVIRQELVPDVVAASVEQDSLGGIELALEESAPVELVRPVVLHLIWTGVLSTDLTRPLGRHSPVSPGPVS